VNEHVFMDRSTGELFVGEPLFREYATNYLVSVTWDKPAAWVMQQHNNYGYLPAKFVERDMEDLGELCAKLAKL